MKVTMKSYVSQVKIEAAKATNKALEQCGLLAETYAKMICPVDTGRLRNSITHAQLDEKTEVIGSNVKYAPYVELGTRRQKAQPYLRPAAEDHGAEYSQIIRNFIAGR